MVLGRERGRGQELEHGKGLVLGHGKALLGSGVLPHM